MRLWQELLFFFSRNTRPHPPHPPRRVRKFSLNGLIFNEKQALFEINLIRGKMQWRDSYEYRWLKFQKKIASNKKVFFFRRIFFPIAEFLLLYKIINTADIFNFIWIIWFHLLRLIRTRAIIANGTTDNFSSCWNPVDAKFFS